DHDVVLEEARAAEAVEDERRRERDVVRRRHREARDDALGEELVADGPERRDRREALVLRLRRGEELQERVAEARLRLGRRDELEVAPRGQLEPAPLDVATERLERGERAAALQGSVDRLSDVALLR